MMYLPTGTWTVIVRHLHTPLKIHLVEEDQPVATTLTVHTLALAVITPWPHAVKYSPPQLLVQRFDLNCTLNT